MKFGTSFFWLLHQLFFCFTLLVYTLSYFAFTGYWLVSFLVMCLPVLLIVHAILLVFLLFIKSRKVWLSALALILSFPFWARTWKIPHSTEFLDTTPKDISVMSYNVMSFDLYHYLENKSSKNTLALIEWVKNTEADVKCFQEFYNANASPDLNTIQQFTKAGYKHYTTLTTKHKHYYRGLVIMSKYPIVKRGEKEFLTPNGMLYADIKIGKDTLRIINLHLRSMIVRFGGLKEAYQEKDYDQGKSETRKVFAKLKRGFVFHAKETQLLTQWIERSPHPVLLCGDFNETPYGYAYGEVRQRLSNAFENAGSGFGFSYQNAPRYIRIDNQFYDKKRLEVLDFQTRSDIKYSDHYPIIGRYKLL